MATKDFCLPPVDTGEDIPSWICSTPADVEDVLRVVLTGTVEDVQRSLRKCNLASDLRRFFPVVAAAAQKGDCRTLLLLFSSGIPTACLTVWDAIKSRSSDVFQIMLDNGWEINSPLAEKEPPALAHVIDNEGLTQWFLDHQADPNAACVFDITPLSYAVYKAPVNIIEMLFQHGGDTERGQLLHHAVKRPGADAADVVQSLLDRGAFINEIKYSTHPYSYRMRQRLGLGTALHKAVELGRSELVSLLLKNGADPTIKDTKGVTCIEQAEISGHEHIKQLLAPRSAI